MGAVIRLPVLLIVVSLLWSCSPGPEADPRNVLLITIDSARRGHFSCYGYREPTTPEIDRLAARGARFEDGVTSGVGTPSAMAALFTSRVPRFADDAGERPRALWGMERFIGPGEKSYGIPSALVSLPELLKHGGYSTAGFAPNPYLYTEFGFGRGFDHYDTFRDVKGTAYAPAAQVTGRAMAWLEKRGGGRFFLFVHFMDAHAPWRLPDSPGAGAGLSAGELASVNETYMGDATTEQKRAVLASAVRLYDEGLKRIDREVGRLVQRLRERGELERTIIVITADHGEELLEHGDTFHRGTVYEETLRVPLIAVLPGRVPPNLRDPARIIDIYPTIAELTGIRSPAGIDGVSLLAPERPREVAIETRRYRALRTPRFKLIQDRLSVSAGLYDLVADPRESRDLALSEPEEAGRLAARLEQLLAGEAGRR